ncbi:MAG: YceI family protein [Flavobacteriales bacterium]|nr:YceI family protein [Flavobacteriales bacterium]
MKLLLISIAGLLTWASSAPFSTIYKTEKTKLSFSSEAPMEIIKAESDKLLGLLDTEKKSFAFQVSVITFEGFNSDLQREHFNENYMESTKYPKTKFTGKILENIDFTKPGSQVVSIEGDLSVHGISKSRKIKATLEKVGNKIIAKSNFDVTLSDHQISIPTIVNQKLAKVINIDVYAEMLPKE